MKVSWALGEISLNALSPLDSDPLALLVTEKTYLFQKLHIETIIRNPEKVGQAETLSPEPEAPNTERHQRQRPGSLDPYKGSL